jgi:hypothetical protein
LVGIGYIEPFIFPTEMNIYERINERVYKQVVAQCENLVVPENLLDLRIDYSARQTILRMVRGTSRQRADALGVVAAIKLGLLNEIHGSSEESIKQAFNEFRSTFKIRSNHGSRRLAA